MSKGKFAGFAALPLANDALIYVLFTGTETDAVLRDCATLTAVIATNLDEATFAGYARVTATGITVTVDNTNDRVDVDTNDPSWSPTTAQALTRIGLFYDDDTTGGTDTNLVPVFIDDFAVTTPTAGTVTYTVAAAGFGRAS